MNLAINISQDRQRTGMSPPHVASHPSAAYASGAANAISSGFNVAPGQALNDSLAQSRPQYQPGYLLSLAQSQTTPVTGSRHEEPLLIPTRAKIGSMYSRNTPSDFGSDSIFESTSKHRHREVATDENGPPTSSVVDLVSEIHSDPRRQLLNNPRQSVMLRKDNNRANSPPTARYQTLYVTVFGYPPSRASVTTDHFQSVGEGGTTEPEPIPDVENAFKIGYKQPWEAARAWRRNGEIISGEGGRWMVGVKWVDPLVAEQVLGSAARASSFSSSGAGAGTPHSSTQEYGDVSHDPTRTQLQQVATRQQESVPLAGTPMKLAPSTIAFRKTMPGASREESLLEMDARASNSPARMKGMIGQVSDLIFGW